MSSTIIATEKLGRDAVAEILPAGVPVIDTKRVISFIRTTPDGERILFGGGHGLPRSAPPQCRDTASDDAVDLPATDRGKITHSWSGLMGFSFDFLPKLGIHQGVHYALACNGGSGIVMMSWLGRKAARISSARQTARAILKVCPTVTPALCRLAVVCADCRQLVPLP